MSILIVDDDAGIRELLNLFLTHKGYRSASAANGADALAILQDHPPLPELILLDVMMPVMDGPAFREAQAQDPHLGAIPVVVMSAVENIQDQAPRMAAAAYLPKPIDFDALLALVEQYCQRSRQQGE